MKRSYVNTPASDAPAALALLVCAGVFTATAPALFAERQPYDRYAPIVDRQMFGPLPPNFDPTKSPSEVSRSSGSKTEQQLTQEQEKVKSAIRFSVINVTPEGETAIGFTDNSDSKNPVHYYLKVGEERNGWLVKEADAKTATMTICKEGIEVSLTLGGDSAAGAGKTENVRPVPIPANAPQRSSLLAGASLGARRRMRRELDEAERRKSEEERAKLEAERVKLAAEREQLEAEREEQRKAEREEQRQALMQLKEEIQKAREQRSQNEQKQQNTDAATGENTGE